MANEHTTTNSRSGLWWLSAGFMALAWWAVGESSKGPEDLTRPNVTFEPTDINARWVVVVGGGVLAFALLVTVVLYPVFEHFLHVHAENTPPALPEFTHGVVLPPEPQLQQLPRRDLGEYIDQQQFELHRYNVVNRQTGAVTIPIERAMDLLVQRGIPPQKAPPPNTFYQPRAGTRLTGLEGKVEPQPR
ncbi:MAG TPA: hypothetical protein VF123_11805 [Candidatus Sulfotelmatobacter sp.]